MKRLTLFFVLLLMACSMFAQGVAKVFTGVFDGLERSYTVYLPKDLKQGAPLVFVLHGYGAIMEQVLDKGFSEAAEKYGVLSAGGQGWPW